MTATIDKSGDRVRRMFGQIAPHYDRMNHLLSMNVDRWWRRQTVRAVQPLSNEPILDVCTGTGDLALALCRASGGQAPVVAADFCREMLTLGRRKWSRSGLDGAVSFIEADAQDLPFPSDRFQLVTVAFGLRNVADTNRGLSEMVRVCRPGGRVAVLEFSMPRYQPMRSIYRCYFRYVLPRLGQWLARNSEQAYSYLPASVDQFPEGAALLERMQAAGLRDVSFRPLTFGVATLYLGTKAAVDA